MSSQFDRFVDATSISPELALVIDPDKLPDFDATTHSREEIAAELGPMVGTALKAHAELLGGAPLLNAAREQHVARAEASLARAADEHRSGFEATLRPSPKGAALGQFASNELSASTQLGGAVTSMATDLSAAYAVMNERLAVLDTEAALVRTNEEETLTWSSLARGVITHYLHPKKD